MFYWMNEDLYCTSILNQFIFALARRRDWRQPINLVTRTVCFSVNLLVFFTGDTIHRRYPFCLRCFMFTWMFYAVIQVDYMFFKQDWNGDTRNFKRYTSGQRHYMHHLLWVLVTARLVLPLIVGLDRVYEGCFPIGYGSGNIGDWFIHLHGTVMHIPRGTSGVPVPPVAGTHRTRWQVSVYITAFRSYIWTLNLVLFDIWSCRFLFTPPHLIGVLFRKW